MRAILIGLCVILAGCRSETTPAANAEAASRTKASAAVLDRRSPNEPDCVLTSETDGWELIENNAVRTADAYAVERRSAASFATGRVKITFQVGGEHEGKYLATISDGYSFAQLEPTFDFCTSAKDLDDEGQLWRVVVAKHLGATI